MITRIGDTPIDNQGMIKLDKDLRVSFAYLVQHVAKNGKVPLSVVRAGKPVNVDLPVSAEHPTLVTDLRGGYPSYFIYGPLVFSTATWQLISGLESNAGMMRVLGFVKSPLITRALDPPDAEREELVVISSPFFPHKLANGYSSPAGSVVVFDQRHEDPQPASARRAAARPEGQIRHGGIRSEGRRGAGVPARRHGRGDRRDPHRQRRAGARLPRHARRLAGQGGPLDLRNPSGSPPRHARNACRGGFTPFDQ